MKHTLVGYTGFVGQNLASKHKFDNLYNSKNISSAFGADNGFVIYSGVPSEKYLANTNPEADFAAVQNAFANIEKMRPQALALISTVDVYPKAVNVNEDSKIESGEEAYGKNRLWLEGQVRQAYPNALIVRLPALFGQGIKKNFIFDILTISPAMLTQAKYEELAAKSSLVKNAYSEAKNGFYAQNKLNENEKVELKNFFEANDFNALCFTDSRSYFQFYNLARLAADIETLMKSGVLLANMATQPVSAAQIYEKIYGKSFVNHTAKGAVFYDMQTKHAPLFEGGANGYVENSEQVLAQIEAFVKNGGKQ